MVTKGTILVRTIGQGVMMSGDDGASWTRASVRLGMHSDAIVKCLLADPERPETVYAGTDLGLYRTDDEGAKWQRLAPPLNASKGRGLALHPVGPRGTLAGPGTPSTPGTSPSTDAAHT